MSTARDEDPGTQRGCTGGNMSDEKDRAEVRHEAKDSRRERPR